MSGYHAAIELLANCGFEQRWTEGMTRYYGNRYTWFMYDVGTNGVDFFEVVEPVSWPGLQDIVPLSDQKALTESEISVESLCKYLGFLRAQAVRQGFPARTVFRALAMFHEQWRMFQNMGANAAPWVYTYYDCLLFAAAAVEIDDLRRLARLQLPMHLMRQVCDGEIAVSLVLKLYDPANVTELR